MPRGDPSRSSESATRHLFRHLFDEQELLRNPYVGSALRAGRLTLPELHARIEHAANAIEREDRTAGNRERGERQAVCLLDCTLKRRPPAEVARDMGISERQLFRDRQSAWTRAVRYLIAAEPSGPNEPSFADVQCNYAAQLFSSGRRDTGGAILSSLLESSTGMEAVMLAALGAELHHGANDRASADNLLARARSNFTGAAIEHSALCKLTLMLLGELLETNAQRLPSLRLNADLADAMLLERGVRWWMVRLAARLLIAKYRRAVATYDRPGAQRAAAVAIALGERVPDLPQSEAFDLRLLTAHVDWSERGLTPRAEAALIANYLTATANGALTEVAQTASLLASMMTIAGKAGGEGYARTALAVAQMLPDDETARFAYLNLAAAELDVGRPANAAQLLARAAPQHSGASAEMEESDAEYAILAREARAANRSARSAPPSSRDSGKFDELAALDPLRAAYRSRITAIELELRDDHHAATRLISDAWEIAARAGDWMSHRTIGRTYRQLIRKPPRT